MAGERRRTFTKNTANYCALGNSGLGTLLSGLAAFSVHARIRIASTTAGVNDNNILAAIINGTSAGMILAVDGSVTKLRVRCRSVSTDALQNLTAGTALSVGVDYFVGAAYDITGKTLTVYLNGAIDAGPTAATFANATWTLGTPTDQDAVGGFKGPPTATTDQFDGLISECGLWNAALSGTDFASLGGGADPSTIAVANLIWNLPLRGLGLPEPAAVSSVNGTITGTIPVYPPIERVGRGRFRRAA